MILMLHVRREYVHVCQDLKGLVSQLMVYLAVSVSRVCVSGKELSVLSHHSSH